MKDVHDWDEGDLDLHAMSKWDNRCRVRPEARAGLLGVTTE
jgi:hypothetical protein